MKIVMAAILAFLAIASVSARASGEEDLALISDVREDAVVRDFQDPKDFFKEVAGRYFIQSVNGEKPHDPSSAIGSFKVSANQGKASLPYCLPNGSCDPNDTDFPYNKTQVTRTAFPDGHIDYTILLKDGAQTLKFTATRKGASFTFRNFQYALTETQNILLVHEMQK